MIWGTDNKSYSSEGTTKTWSRLNDDVRYKDPSHITQEVVLLALTIYVWLEDVEECNLIKLNVMWSVTSVSIIHDLLQVSEDVQELHEVTKALESNVPDRVSNVVFWED
jgi:hypothetical protein